MAINEEWLRAHGVEGDDITLRDVAGHAQAALVRHVIDALSERLRPERLEEFKWLVDHDASEDIRLNWLDRHCPDHESITKRATEEFKREIMTSEHPITYILGQDPDSKNQ